MLRKNKPKTSHSPAMFTPRANDYLKAGIKNRPLSIERDQFSRPAREIKITGGSATYGPYFVKRKAASAEKVYYVSIHSVDDEYFALEVLQYIGINAPKLRVTSGSFSDSQHKPCLVIKNLDGIAAVKSMDGYIPMMDLLVMHHSGYHLDSQQQAIINPVSNENFKISGNVFAAFIAANLINDDDFGLEDLNFGLIRRGNRFYSAAIDKDCALFHSDKIRRIKHRELALFKTTTIDQELFVVSKLQQGLNIDATGYCDFDRIFDNPRVRATPALCKQNLKKCAVLKTRAQNIITHYRNRYPNEMENFHNRESLRYKIACSVLSGFQMEDDARAQMIALIMEDLRGPYYAQYSLETRQLQHLIPVIIADLQQEFPELGNSMKPGNRF